MSTTTSLFQKIIATPIGTLYALADEQSLHRLMFIEDVELASLSLTQTDIPVLKLLKKELHDYFAGTLQQFTVPIALQGTLFQQQTWQQLSHISYGQTISYKELACQLGRPTAFRAAANANGTNPLCIIIPCHRVTASNGSLGGYRYSTERKQWLLNHEKINQVIR